MKPKIIKPGEIFCLNGQPYSYSVVNEAVILKRETDVKKPREKKSFIPPTVHEVTAFFKEKGYAEIQGIRAWEYYTSRDWIDANKKPVDNWKSKMISVWFKDEYKEMKDSGSSNLIM